MDVPLGYQNQAPQTASSAMGGPRNAPMQDLPKTIMRPLGVPAGLRPMGSVANPLLQAMQMYR